MEEKNEKNKAITPPLLHFNGGLIWPSANHFEKNGSFFKNRHLNAFRCVTSAVHQADVEF
jgi:hypothetical protein